MNIIELYENLKGSYKRYLESFITIKDERIKDKVRDSIKNEELWPKALIQFNTNFAKGIGVMVPPCISSSTHLSHIIKTKNPYFPKGMKENVVERLFTADNVVIFGQSLGITDSDYFKPYFYGIIEGKIKRQNIFIVTYNEESFSNIYSNMQEYGIKIEDMKKANVDVHLVYTIKGSQSMEFMQMLTTLYGCYFKN